MLYLLGELGRGNAREKQWKQDTLQVVNTRDIPPNHDDQLGTRAEPLLNWVRHASMCIASLAISPAPFCCSLCAYGEGVVACPSFRELDGLGAEVSVGRI